MTEGRGIFSKLWFIKYVVMGIIVVALIVPFFEDVKDNSTLYMFLFLLPFICFAGAIVFYSSFRRPLELRSGGHSVRIPRTGLAEGDAAQILAILKEARSADDPGATP